MTDTLNVDIQTPLGSAPDPRSSRGRVGPIREGVTSDQERLFLRQGVGELLRRARRARGRSRRWLALATGASLRHVQRLEAGHRRPSEVLLRSIAGALEPDDPGPLGDALVAAAGESLTPGCWRYWWRRQVRAILAGHRPLPSEIAKPMALHRAASSAMAEALSLMTTEHFDDPEAMERAGELIDRARALRDAAGPPFVLQIGPHRFSFGWEL